MAEPALFEANQRAVFSPCGRYRYALWREWAPEKGRCLFVMLNGSRADSERDDPTTRRDIGFARAWGFGALDIGNVYGWRSTNPADLRRVADPVGPDNDLWVERLVRRADLVIVAWGVHAETERADRVLNIIRAAGREPHCLGVTAGGAPKHPLYLPRTARPIPFPEVGRG